jgi:hypothetical protein
MSKAPRSSISRLGDQIHRPVLLSALRTLPLSAVRARARDRPSHALGPAIATSAQGGDGGGGQVG